MIRTYFKTSMNALGIGLLCMALSACDTPPTRVDQHFGQAVQKSLSQGLPADHITDGMTTKAAVDRYHERLLAPPVQAPVFNFNLGTTPAR